MYYLLPVSGRGKAAWWMDGCPSLFLSNVHSAQLHYLIFFPHFVLFRCHFAVCTILWFASMLFFFYFPVCLILLCTIIEGCGWGGVYYCWEKHTSQFLRNFYFWKNMKLLSFCVTFTKFYLQKIKKAGQTAFDNGQMPASLNAVIMTPFGRQHSSTPAKASSAVANKGNNSWTGNQAP